MTTPDFGRMLLLAQLSSIVYKVDPTQLAAAVSEIDCVFVGLVEDTGFQAMVVTNDLIGQIVVFRGTPVTCGRDIEDALVALGYDAGLTHTDVGGGAKVLSGPYQAIKANWPQILRLLDQTKVVTFTGHSLGATEALIAPALLPRTVKVLVVAFAPFQVANGTFWLGLYGGRDLPQIAGRAADFAPGWNHADPVTCQPCTVLHLVNGKFEWLAHWPWYDESISDHDVDLYVNDVRALAAAEQVPA